LNHVADQWQIGPEALFEHAVDLGRSTNAHEPSVSRSATARSQRVPRIRGTLARVDAPIFHHPR
jgi:hypothetical protein